MAFVIVDVAFFIALDSGSRGLGLLVVGAVLLALVALGGIVLAVRGGTYFGRGIGIGLAIGWALMSIISAGYRTGLNPSLYAVPPL